MKEKINKYFKDNKLYIMWLVETCSSFLYPFLFLLAFAIVLLKFNVYTYEQITFVIENDKFILCIYLFGFLNALITQLSYISKILKKGIGKNEKI